jgi:hypothetical protein
MRVSSSALFLLLLSACATPADHFGDTAADFSGDEPLVAEAKSTVLSTCIGDNDYSTSSGCFESDDHSGFTYDSSTSRGYYYNDARSSSSMSASGYWFFRGSAIPSRGEVWFSAWIPSYKTNSNAAVGYVWLCQDPGGLTGSGTFTLNQASYTSGGWVTVGNVGYWAAGSECFIAVTKTGGGTSARMAMDGMKMTVYR